LTPEAVVGTHGIRFRGISYEAESGIDNYAQYERSLSIVTPISPWAVADDLAREYQARARVLVEKGLRAVNPRSRVRASTKELSSLERTALTWIVESQQLTATDVSPQIFSGYYGYEVDYVHLDSPNIDALARAYFALPDDASARLRWLVQGVEGKLPLEMEGDFTCENALVRTQELIGEATADEIALAWQGQGSNFAAAYNHEYGFASVETGPHDGAFIALAVVLAEGKSYRLLSGAKRLHGLEAAQAPVYVIAPLAPF
jgi:hypothetical protein